MQANSISRDSRKLRVAGSADHNGLAVFGRDNPAHLPVAGHFPRRPSARPVLAGSKWKLINKIAHENLRAVQVGNGSRLIQVIRIGEARSPGESFLNIVQQFAECIADLKQQPMCEALVGPQRQRVITRVAHRCANVGDARVLRIRNQKTGNRNIPGTWSATSGQKSARHDSLFLLFPANCRTPKPAGGPLARRSSACYLCTGSVSDRQASSNAGPAINRSLANIYKEKRNDDRLARCSPRHDHCLP